MSGRRVPVARRMLAHGPVRLAITTTGVAIAVMLMLFLFGLYEGVRVESNGYVAGRPVAAWVAQSNSTNFVKSQSLVPMALADSIRAEPGVVEAAPLARLVLLLTVRGQQETVVVCGIEPNSPTGKPDIVDGSSDLNDDDIILDRALARRFHVVVGDTVRLQGKAVRVRGLSVGTNLLLAHLAFVTRANTDSMFGIHGVTSYFLVRGADGVNAAELVSGLKRRLPGWRVMSQAEFAENNMEELRGGLLPLLSTVAVLGALDASALLALLLYGAVLERREDYAVLKAIGASTGVLVRLVMHQSLAAAAAGLLAGVAGYAALSPVVLAVVPQMLLAVSPMAVLLVSAGTLVVGALGALWPLRRVALILPGEVFRT